MNMIVMLAIFGIIYFVTLLAICIYREKINIKVGNVIFMIADLICFSFWTYSYYQMGGLKEGFLTLGNISPLMFTVIVLLPFMKESVRSYAEATIAFLSVGMLLAFFISPEHAYLFSFKQEANLNYTAEAACHMICSLFGLYLIITKQVEPNFKGWIRSMIFIYSIITMAVGLNYIYHRDYFGMNPYGNYKIYMIDIFGSFEATLAAYYFGIMVVLLLGVQFGRLIYKFTLHEKIEL